MTHELVFRVSSRNKVFLTSIKKDIIEQYIAVGTTQIISYSDDGLLEEGEGLRVCRTKKRVEDKEESPTTVQGSEKYFFDIIEGYNKEIDQLDMKIADLISKKKALKQQYIEMINNL